MRRFAAVVLALGWWTASAKGQEAEQEPGPELDFLEYLGTWADDDDEWLAIEEWEKDDGVEAGEDRERSESERDDDDESE